MLFGWKMPKAPICESCALYMISYAIDPDGEGWYLGWICEQCGEVHSQEIEWPFLDDRASAIDLEGLGFNVSRQTRKDIRWKQKGITVFT